MNILESRVYVGTYAKYNSGNLTGSWLDVSDYSDKDEFYEACKELHIDEEDPEYMFQDWENIPDALIGESWISEQVWEVLEWAEGDEEKADAFIAFCDNFGVDFDSFDAFNDSFQGQYNTFRDFSDHLFDEIYGHDIPDSIKYYIDYGAFARDLEIGDYTFIDDGGYVFSNDW